MLKQRVRVGILSGIALVAALSSQAQAASLLVNGDFEDGTYTSTVGGFTNHSVPIGWMANAAFDEFYGYNSVEDSVVESGIHALRISDYDTEPLATLSQSFSDVPGDVYNVTFYAKVGVAHRDPNAYLQVSVGSSFIRTYDNDPSRTTYQKYGIVFIGSGLDTLAIAAQDNPTFLVRRQYLGNWPVRDSQRPRALDLGDDGDRLRYGGARPPSPRSICPCLYGEL